MHTKTFSFALALAATAVLGACGGGDGGDNLSVGKTITGRVALGPVVGATCTVSNAGGAAIAGVGIQTTGDSGVFSLVNIPDAQFPVIVTCSGGNFYDEATNQIVANLANVRAVVPLNRASTDSTTPTVALTPLTSAAVAAFLALPAEFRNNAAAASANTEVANALAPGLDILSPPTAITSANQTLTNSPADQYAVILAALSYLALDAGGDTAQATARFVNGLSADAADGKIDGAQDGTALSNIGYTDFASLIDAIESGTDSYEAANPNAAAATNAVQAQEGNRGDATITPSPTGS